MDGRGKKFSLENNMFVSHPINDESSMLGLEAEEKYASSLALRLGP